MKKKKIQVIIKVLIPVVIIAGCFGAEKVISAASGKSLNKPISVEMADLAEKSNTGSIEVINKQTFGDVKGFKKNFGFINDNEILLGIGLDREEFYKKYPDKIDKTNDENFDLLNEQDKDIFEGEMYTLKLSDLSKKELGMNSKDVYSDLSIEGNKFTYKDDKKMYINDLNNNSKTAYKDVSSESDEFSNRGYIGSWSKDGKCYIYYEDNIISVYNSLDKSTKSYKVDIDKVSVGMFESCYSEDGQDIYFIGRKQMKKGSIQGIYKLSTSNGNIEEKLVLPVTGSNDDDNSNPSGISDSDYCVLENEKRIIFNGVIDGVSGTYICDLENNKFYNVVPHTVENDITSYCSNIWVSPDKTKVIYINLAEEDGEKHWNLYAAKINGNSLTDRICIYKNIILCDSIDSKVKWSPDSKKILFFTGNEYIERNYIRFTDKNEINIITFK